jgi:hypothetical protein
MARTPSAPLVLPAPEPMVAAGVASVEASGACVALGPLVHLNWRRARQRLLDGVAECWDSGAGRGGGGGGGAARLVDAEAPVVDIVAPVVDA